MSAMLPLHQNVMFCRFKFLCFSWKWDRNRQSCRWGEEVVCLR